MSQRDGFGWHSTAMDVTRGLNLCGRQIVLTGASSGIGLELVRALAKTKAALVLGVRDLDKAARALKGLDELDSGRIRVERLELADPASVVKFASRIARPVDILIANAGVSKTPNSHLPNGLDVRFATNHLGHFLLAHCLKRQMAERGARLVVLSSAGHKGMPVRLDDLQWKRRSHVDGAAYGESKSANILFAHEATRRWAREGIFTNAVLPGSALTGLQRFHGEALKREIGFIDVHGALDPMVKTPAQAAATAAWAATAPELEGRGALVLEDCNEAVPVDANTHKWSGFDRSIADPEIARLLWERSIELLEQLLGKDLCKPLLQ